MLKFLRPDSLALMQIYLVGRTELGVANRQLGRAVVP